MTKSQYRWSRRLMLFMAAAPLFQLGACDNVTRQVLASVANSLPSTIFSILQSAFLAPFLALVAGGGTGGGGI